MCSHSEILPKGAMGREASPEGYARGPDLYSPKLKLKL